VNIFIGKERMKRFLKKEFSLNEKPLYKQGL
jgi:hypothetical protein